MFDIIEVEDQQSQSLPRWSLLAYIVIVGTVGNAVLLVSRLTVLNWKGSALLACSTAALAAGAFFAVLEMHRLHSEAAAKAARLSRVGIPGGNSSALEC